MAAQDDVVLRERQRLAGRDADLLAHDVDAGHRLRDGVLDLHARVHLEEVVGAVGVEQSLDGPGRAVADGACGVDRDRADPSSELVVDRRRRRLLDELLMASLDRAVALAEVDDVPVRVGQDLHLDVSRIVEVALDVDGGVGEVRLALPSRSLERPLDLVLRARDPQSLSAAAGRRLDGDRVARPRRAAASTSATLVAGAVVPGTTGTPAARMRSRAAIFEPIASIASGGGPIQTSPASSTRRANSAFSARNP